MARPKPAATDAKRVYTQPRLPVWLTQHVIRNRALWRNGAGIALVAGGAITLVTLLGWNAGGAMSAWAGLLRQAFGAGAYLLAVLMVAFGVPLLLNTRVTFGAGLLAQVIAGEVAFLSFLALMHSLAFSGDSLALAQAGGGGGAFGWTLSRLMWMALGSDAGLSRLLGIGLWFVVLALSAVVAFRPWLTRPPAGPLAGGVQVEPEPEPEHLVVIGQGRPADAATEPPAVPERAKARPAPRPDLVLEPPSRPAGEPVRIKSQAAIIRDDDRKAAPDARPAGRKPRAAPSHSEDLPPLTILKSAKETRTNDADVRHMADIIETTLAHFGLAGKVVEIRRGPTVTQFGIEPGYLERGAQNRDKTLQKFRAAVANAVYDAVKVEMSSDRTSAVIDIPAAIADARESGLRSLLKALLADSDLSTAIAERDRRAGRALFDIGADTERKLKIKAGQVSSLQRNLASNLADALFQFDAFGTSDMLTERLIVAFPAGIAEAVDLKDRLEAVVMDLGLAATIDLGRRATQAVIEWQKQTQKVRVGQIASLHNDFALALEAPSIRIEAPIPGRGLVGIEVPNSAIGVVDVRGVMESEVFQKIKSPLAIALGRDVAGKSVAADLGRMPHLLIAGTTGSGKSVCIGAITVCLTMANRPEDLKLVMIDPKMVELSRFVGLPHIIGRPESDLDRIPGVLRWVTREMDSRYKKFAEAGARNLADFNDTLTRRGEETLPRIVLLIDELADLMLQSPIETEKTICRLAQMARATGIHLVVATQRPSVDVVTGLIKANFPARIAFSVASSTDSRVILDQVGAETLLGRGDMLFLNPEAGHPLRLQGCLVTDKEIESLIGWWKKQTAAEKEKAEAEAPPEAASEEGEGGGGGEAYTAHHKPELDTPWEIEVAELQSERAMAAGSRPGRGGTAEEEGGDDDLVKRALDIIQATGNVSTSLLQRKLRIGYPRAARLMEELQEMGYVGGASRQAGKGREVKHKDDE